MDRNRFTSTVCTLLLLAVPGLAATIQLKNGDRVTGQPYGVTDGKLVLSTDSFGEIQVDLAKVVSIESEEPITVVLASGDTLTGTVTHEGENSIRITSGTGSIVTGMEDVANLAPAPEILAMGDGIEAEIEVLGAEAEENPWSGNIALGFSLFTGNNDRLGFNLTVQAVRETDDDRFQADLLIRYAEDQGARNTNEKIMVFRQDVKMGEEKDWYLFGQLYLENDEFEDLDLRAALSLGAGWVLSKAEGLRQCPALRNASVLPEPLGLRRGPGPLLPRDRAAALREPEPEDHLRGQVQLEPGARHLPERHQAPHRDRLQLLAGCRGITPRRLPPRPPRHPTSTLRKVCFCRFRREPCDW